MHRVIPFIIFLLVFLTGCTGSGNEVKRDETGQKTIIAHVNADAVYLISIRDKVESYLSYHRSVRTVLFQPSPDDLLKLEYTALGKVIRQTGLSQPGNDISSKDIVKLAEEIAIEKGNEIAAQLRKSGDFESVAEQYKIEKPSDTVRMIKGRNPVYDDAVWDAEIGAISGPVVHYDRVLIFKVIERGTNDRGEDWADIKQLDFLFPRDEAQRRIEKELSDKWNIRIQDKFYSAIDNYFNENYENAREDLNKYLQHKGERSDIAAFLMCRVLEKINEANPDDKITAEIGEYFTLAIEKCADLKMKPYYFYELALNLENSKDITAARDKFREAFDNSKMDIVLVPKLASAFERIGDDEYHAKALKKLQALDELLKTEQAKQPGKLDIGNLSEDKIELNSDFETVDD
ncbi:hypothetical protein J7L05_01220 [bacterium]|nr:hypothetical protein [bacterium]